MGLKTERLRIITQIREIVHTQIEKEIRTSISLNLPLSKNDDYQAYTQIWNKLFQLEANN